jgi:hypothetical protein
MFLTRTRHFYGYYVLAVFLAMGVGVDAIESVLDLDALPRALGGDLHDKASNGGQPGIQHIDLIHFSHTDIGFTDHPAVCRELQKRYLDIAIDAVLATCDKPESARFHWTAEGTVAVDEWWRSATTARRADFLKAIDSGQLDISALAMNNTPFMNGQEWQTMLHWLPEELWQRVQPKVALQNDVNGIPRAGAMALLGRGIHQILSGINDDSGGAPFHRPSAFWWKMPDGRKLFVYLGYSYPAGYDFFEPVGWRRGPVPRASDTCYRPPRAGDFLGSDEASVRKAHGRLLQRIRGLEAEGYRYPMLLLSITNQWRIDNDPPFPPLADFVAAWNRLELKPTLRLTTASVAMKRLQDEIGSRVPEYQGEWTDWWANGTASAPREVAASRIAKRLLDAAESPVWGAMNANGRRTVDELLRDLCFFDEHTWGSSNSVALPYGLDTQAQFNEKASLAFRPMVRAEWLLAQRVRSRLAAEAEGLYVANSSPSAWSGWVRMPASALRDDYRSLEDSKSGGKTKMYFENGFRPFATPQNPGELTRENTAATFPDNCERQTAKFWVEGLPGQSIRKLQLSKKDADDDRSPTGSTPIVTVDRQGWPVGITWPGMAKPLFLPGLGDFIAVRAKGFAPRWAAMRLAGGDSAQREKLRREVLEESTAAAAENSAVQNDPHTIVYTQPLSHPRLSWATRRLEVWKGEPRARLALRFNRISSEDPEAFFVVFPLPCESTMPQTSCGGVPFVPFSDQLPGTCRDYFAIDGWIHYATPAGHWIWASRDAPLVTFGAPQVKARRTDAPKDVQRVLAMIFENFWYTNFVGDSHGAMEFQFDLAWRKELSTKSAIDDFARTLVSEPQVMINPGLKEDPILLKRLYEP